MIKTYDFKMVRGETKSLEFTVVDEKGKTVDLTGASCYMRWRPDPKADPVIELDTLIAGGVVIEDQTVAATKGKFKATILPAKTSALPVGDYKWDAWVVLADTSRHAVIAMSTVSLLQEVTTLP
jgi:hypothetical protein